MMLLHLGAFGEYSGTWGCRRHRAIGQVRSEGRLVAWTLVAGSGLVRALELRG